MVNVKALLVLNIVTVLVTYSFAAEESSQNSIQQKRNIGDENLPLYQANLRQTEVNYDQQNQHHGDHRGYEQHQQHQSDWEMQKARAQGLTHHGSSQHYQQPWIPQPDYIQHNHISQQLKSQQQVPQPIPQQVSKYYLHQHPQQIPPQQVQLQVHQPAQLFKPVNQYPKPQENHMAAHRVVYPVSILMRPPAPTVSKKIPIYMNMYHVPKPVPVVVDKPFTWMYMDQSSGKQIPMQVIIRDVNHGKKPFWSWS